MLSCKQVSTATAGIKQLYFTPPQVSQVICRMTDQFVGIVCSRGFAHAAVDTKTTYKGIKVVFHKKTTNYCWFAGWRESPSSPTSSPTTSAQIPSLRRNRNHACIYPLQNTTPKPLPPTTTTAAPAAVLPNDFSSNRWTWGWARPSRSSPRSTAAGLNSPSRPSLHHSNSRSNRSRRECSRSPRRMCTGPRFRRLCWPPAWRSRSVERLLLSEGNPMSLVFQNPKYWPPCPLTARRVCPPRLCWGGRTHSPGGEGGWGSIFWKTRYIGLTSYSNNLSTSRRVECRRPCWPGTVPPSSSGPRRWRRPNGTGSTLSQS